ncbi:GNAT family N-acetyltransferase [Streptomyces europaeiscabiei]|uniref:GNAT family N-acetyltransferase n=1 Tax=Streptomyces europaeiscabiei TaxID=146819 RepID=UPI0029BE433C|nr:GNAT family N-acetyltransferase [Streptomyces europaeiscabiei]MDX2757327.1 GNAT family N-acetyltransferase [Streptomyces europaeiscabiei]
MQTVLAVQADLPAWLRLAGEVEDLFGPLVDNPRFRAALQRNVERGTALCVRDAEGVPGLALAGGLLMSVHPPRYEISWLAVGTAFRGRGIGALLVRSALRDLAAAPGTVEVTTFGPDHPGRRARGFYERLGFEPTDSVSADGTRQTYQLHLQAV